MAILANAKHERFAQELAKGRPAVQAHKTAGLDGNSGNASRLQRRDSIVQRVAELIDNRAKMEREATEKATEALSIDQAWLIARAEEARQGAMEARQHAAAVSAIKEIGILTGLRIERRDHTHRTVHEMSDDELLAIARGGPSPSAEDGAPLVH